MSKITSFVGETTEAILAAVEADSSVYGVALAELAGRVMREKPRPQAVSGFLSLVTVGEDAPARPTGDAVAYKAWIAAAQKQAQALGVKASPKAKTSTAKAKASKPAAKRTSKPKASNDIAAKIAAMTPAERKVLATFFAGL